MSTYPRAVWKFIPWSKAMVAGATVGTPEYKASDRNRGTNKTSTRRRRRRRKTRKNAKKD